MIEKIVRKIGLHFRTFGGGRGTPDNPVAQALKDQPLCFAVAVDVADVVAMVLNESGYDDLLRAAIEVVSDFDTYGVVLQTDENMEYGPTTAIEKLRRAMLK